MHVFLVVCLCLRLLLVVHLSHLVLCPQLHLLVMLLSVACMTVSHHCTMVVIRFWRFRSQRAATWTRLQLLNHAEKRGGVPRSGQGLLLLTVDMSPARLLEQMRGDARTCNLLENLDDVGVVWDETARVRLFIFLLWTWSSSTTSQSLRFYRGCQFVGQGRIPSDTLLC